jgi:transcriptional regulator with XRE-family HTH domain
MDEQVKIKKLKEELGLTIRRRRHKLGISQEELADRANIHRTYVSSIELAKVDLGISVTLKIATALGIPLSKLIKEAENNI